MMIIAVKRSTHSQRGACQITLRHNLLFRDYRDILVNIVIHAMHFREFMYFFALTYVLMRKDLKNLVGFVFSVEG